jgi:7-cyano-7-deazaguanine reductase
MAPHQSSHAEPKVNAPGGRGEALRASGRTGPRNPAARDRRLSSRGVGVMALSMSDKPALHLGQQSTLPASPEQAVLDYVPNPRAGALYMVRFAAPEFTSLCPVTGQPDFAHLVIDYAPGQTIVESKSLKLFLGSFRNHCGFHEDVTVGIGQRLFEEMQPLWLRIGGYWYPRGGIPIDVFWQSGPLPEGLWAPDQGVQGYRGRG